MRVGVVGLGRVGLPLALVLAEHGRHEVVGHDLDNERVADRLRDPEDRGELGLGKLVAAAAGKLRLVDDPEQVVAHAELVFVAVQTPHAAGYGGEVPAPAAPADFDYRPLSDALAGLHHAAAETGGRPVVAVVSTVLPGTLRRLGDAAAAAWADQGLRLPLAYNPAFVALGSVVPDLLGADFLLVGADDPAAAARVEAAWATLAFPVPVHRVGLESAELLKVALNAYLSAKVAFANTLAELAEAVGADVDEVTDGLLLSNKAAGSFGLRAGLGDGGPCRPRDLIALSWLARRHGVHPNPFGVMVRGREAHTRRLAELAAKHARDRGAEVWLLGWSYKPGSTVVDGSAARLLWHYLQAEGVWCRLYDPLAVPEHLPPSEVAPASAVFVVAVPHEPILRLRYPPGSLVIDPHGAVADQPGVEVLRVGRR